jgi:hypothetical protein
MKAISFSKSFNIGVISLGPAYGGEKAKQEQVHQDEAGAGHK